MKQNFIQFYNTKNRICTYLKHLPSSLAWQIIPLHILLTEAIVFRSLLHSISLAWSVQRGIFWGIINGFRERFKEPPKDYQLNNVIKKPDLSYYKALFSSLKNYNKLW